MSDIFSVNFFAGNRKRLREQVNADTPIVITANGQMQKAGDAAFSFQQDANFWYLTGINKPEITIAIDTSEEYLILPKITSYQLAFDGDLDASELAKTSGIKLVLDNKSGWERLSARLKSSKQAATILPAPSYVKVYGFYSNPARRRLVEKLKRTNSKLDIIDVRQQLAALRMVKQPAELTAIRTAIDITIDSINDAIASGKLSKYSYEYELKNEINYGFLKRGVNVGFDSIVASGMNATTLHIHDTTKNIEPSDLIVIDVGAEVQQYDADITRTISVNKQPSKRQTDVYNAVLEAQDFGFSLMKPGAYLRDNERAIESFIGEKLQELGLIKTIDRKSVRKYYPHALSHSLGIDTHDAANYELPLAPGMILTVEPGIYIPEEGIGVRIEDDVLITDKGHKVLSRNLGRKL